MAYGIKLHVWGDYACFTRPEMKVERVSYDVITPSAARGILEAIHWKPAICWVIDRIHVLRPVRFESIQRNELKECKVSTRTLGSAMKNKTTTSLGVYIEDERTQRATTLLRNVGYVIEAHFDLTNKAGTEDSIGKHLDIFNRRARKGQYFHQPCLGNREFPAYFSLIEHEGDFPKSELATASKDLGWMLHDIDFANGAEPRFFRAELKDGIIDVPPLQSSGVVK
ncbi:type I-C CRISPR-associated protein Cas5c [Pseudoalteromonas sp. L23]|uniref:type I-C CRISPR-associated protein Cas5c n=1 Tax=Pseudoalteromonas TaxID=53246 RepID=UPI00029AB013|nr:MULTISPECIES: type I-C CRISPR-associated protein Cas5c [Pseudoalteromonas]MCF7515462.1 type I-C CRISPR-associated protein Cas5c [Pseudoalteromonas sp. L7]MCF7527359.1 type I-C CRISPR-associated protein Cas5c [Pseudoalteromonas sp. L23]MCX2767725.1 type I-C CRISPR-associated protein Cas5c [Pseudoalteromonas sp. B530]